MIIFKIIMAWIKGIREMDVDMDGSVISGELDRMFNEIGMSLGYDVAIAWYKNEGWRKGVGLRVNKIRLAILWICWKLGMKLNVWTNRFDFQEENTRKDLGKWAVMFSEWMFFGGKKGKDERRDGVIRFDNDGKYCGKGDINVGTWI